MLVHVPACRAPYMIPVIVSPFPMISAIDSKLMRLSLRLLCLSDTIVSPVTDLPIFPLATRLDIFKL